MMKSVPFSPWPSFTQEEADKALSVLLSNKVNYWTGQEGREFEKEFAAFADCDYGIAVTNGTIALDLALHGLGIGARNGGSECDEVIVTSRTFLASASSIVFAGARPVFADVDSDSQNITAETIHDVLSPNTKAIICVHLAGWPCEMDAICELADEHNLKVIEDCAQAHGARYKGKSVGSFGDVAAWSFCQDKIMTTGGEGGMVTTNSHDLWDKMWSFKDHGKSYEAVYNQQHPPGFRWLHESFGTNWRLTEMQSAIGRIQLQRMPDWKAKRQANSRMIAEACTGFSCVRVPDVPDYIEHACYKFYVFVKPDALAEGWTRDRIVEAMNARGVPCMQGSCSEVYLEKAFDNTGYRPEKPLPVAHALGETSLMFLVHPTLSVEAMKYTAQVTTEVMERASRKLSNP